MNTKQDERKKVVIGYDFTDEYAQISYFFLDQEQPETMKAYQGESYNIPVCLCKKHGVNQWYYGQQAVKSSEEGKGTLFTNLLSLAVQSETVTVDGQSIAARDLLFLFVKKCLGMLGLLIDGFLVEGLMITLETLTEKTAKLMEQMKKELPYDEDKIYIQTHEESLFYYLVNQKKELWNHDVAVFDFSSDKLRSYYFTINRKTTPHIASIEKRVYPHFSAPMDEKLMIDKKQTFAAMDQRFLALLEEFTKGKLISSVYLIGKGFDGEWYRESLSFLCRKRKAFGGNNLYSKGACYGAREKYLPGQVSESYLFLGNDKLRYNIGILSLKDGKEACHPLLDAGVNWYEVKYEGEFLFDEGDALEFVVTSIYGETRICRLELSGLTGRPPKTTRLGVRLLMQNEHRLQIQVKDKGFGNFFLPTDGEWEGVLEL